MDDEEQEAIIAQMKESNEKNSMLYWWPRVQNLPGIRVPKTVMVEIPTEAFRDWIYADAAKDIEGIADAEARLREADRKMGRPSFIRSDQMSGKHDWDRTCFLAEGENLMRHVYAILEEHELGMMGPPYNAVIFREYIPMATKFTAFCHKFPVGKERRYFVEDGKVVCHHAYWPADSMRDPSVENWREILQALNFETDSEVRYLIKQAEKVGSRLEGAWSVDFTMSAAGRWIFIDAALARDSYHPPECAHAKDWKRLYG